MPSDKTDMKKRVNKSVIQRPMASYSKGCYWGCTRCKIGRHICPLIDSRDNIVMSEVQ